MKAATFLLDPIPTYLFQSCYVSLCPVVFSIIKDYLCTGVVPAAFKIAGVTPVPKKIKNHPIYNLPFLAKLLEQVFATMNE